MGGCRVSCNCVRVCARAVASAGPAASPASFQDPAGLDFFSSPRDLTFPTAGACVPVRLPGTATDPFPSSFPSSAPASVGSFSPPFPPGSL